MATYYGTTGNDKISGQAVAGASDQIDALAGDDTVSIGTGQIFVSGPGSDTVTGSGGNSGYAAWYATQRPVIDLARGVATNDGFGFQDILSGIGTVHLPGRGGSVIGGAADETVFVFGGPSTIDMGAGTDTALYYKKISTDYQIQWVNGQLQVTDLKARTVDTLQNVEGIVFDDRSINAAYFLAPYQATLQYTAHSFTETQMAPAYTYAGVVSAASLVPWFPQATFLLDANGDGAQDVIVPMNKGYATGLGTRTPFVALTTSLDGKLSFSTEVNAQMPVTSGARRAAPIDLAKEGAQAVVTIAHDTHDGQLADLELLRTGPGKLDASGGVPSLPASSAVNRSHAVDAHSMATGDLNGDGRTDILVGEWRGQGMFALLQNADGTFAVNRQPAYQSITSNWPMVHPGVGQGFNLLVDLAIVDANGDGYGDIVAGWGHGSTTSRIFLSDKGTFASDRSVALPESVYGIDNQMHLKTLAADFDRDGDTDLFVLWSRYVPYYGGNYLQLLLNDGKGTYTDATRSHVDKPFQDMEGSRLQWTDAWSIVDANGDGTLDIVGHRATGDKRPFVLANDGGARFTTLDVLQETWGGAPIAWGDWDRDGKLEYLSWNSKSNNAGTASLNSFDVYELSNALPKVATLVAPKATVQGTSSDDVIARGAGPAKANDVVDGGVGHDTVTYAGNLTAFKVVKSPTGFTVTQRAQPAVTDQLVRVEKISFNDKTVDLTVQEKAGLIASPLLKSVIELYVAFFNRVPDGEGMAYWISRAATGASISSIAESFYDAAIQYSSLTGYSKTMSNGDFVNVIYKNVLGRPSADADGLAYWSAALADGTQSRGTLVSSILESAHTFKGNATWGWVADLLDNKHAVGKMFSVELGLSYTTPEESISQGMAIARAVTATSAAPAVALIGVNFADLALY